MEKRTWAVITSNRSKAKKVIERLESRGEVAAKLDNEENLQVIFCDDVCVIWLRPVESVTGFAFQKAWIDCDVDEVYLRTTVLPMIQCDMSDISWF